MAGASTLLLDEHFAAGDARFLDEVLASSSGKWLKSFAKRWFDDARPFAREALHRYIGDGCDRPHHRPLVKALFKMAEAAGDDVTMGHFMVAFDRMIARNIGTMQAWDYKTRTYSKVPVYSSVPGLPLTAKGDKAPRFSKRTRRYLQRRAFRYFRRFGKKDPVRFGRGVRAALALYQDTHLDSPQKLLDSWSLLHALYGRSAVLKRVPRGIVLAPGKGLSDLSPSPIHPDAWKDCLGDLVTLVKKAESRTVRVFALDLLKRDYAEELHKIPVLRLRALLLSPHEEAQTFAAELLQKARDIHLLPIADWLELLSIETQAALGIICDLVIKHVSPTRLSLPDCVALGCQRPAPVAELGLEWARKKKLSTEEDLVTLLAFAKAECPSVREKAAGWVAEVLEKSLATTPLHVRDLLDSKYSEVRGHAMQLLTRDARFKDSPLLWGALSESPYSDARAFLLRHIEARKSALAEGSMRGIWASVLLGIARGSRDKRRALSQLASTIIQSPEKADDLLPLLSIALRSVRAPERRAALTAVARAAAQSPSLTSAIASKLPEIRFESAEVVR